MKTYLGLGANLANKEENIRKTIALLRQNRKIKITKCSSLYRTSPVGMKNQPWYVNCVIEIKTTFSPEKLLNLCQALEKKIGSKKRKRFSSREIDIDILACGDKIIRRKNLVIPHPEIQKRKFVLVPWAEVAPDAKHPTENKTINQLLNETTDPGQKIFKLKSGG